MRYGDSCRSHDRPANKRIGVVKGSGGSRAQERVIVAGGGGGGGQRVANGSSSARGLPWEIVPLFGRPRRWTPPEWLLRPLLCASASQCPRCVPFGIFFFHYCYFSYIWSGIKKKKITRRRLCPAWERNIYRPRPRKTGVMRNSFGDSRTMPDGPSLCAVIIVVLHLKIFERVFPRTHPVIGRVRHTIQRCPIGTGVVFYTPFLRRPPIRSSPSDFQTHYFNGCLVMHAGMCCVCSWEIAPITEMLCNGKRFSFL